jgi:[acyl-carrier-protein] S-malonyltransferase
MTNDSYKKIAFIFPGQGSQSIGMFGEIAKKFVEIKDFYEEASEVLGFDLWQLVCSGPEEKLNQTMYTQPALLVGEAAMWMLFSEKTDFMPEFFAGHSLGEYTALVCTGAIDYIDAIELVFERGRLMQEAVAAGVGGMAAIVGLNNEQIAEVCKQAAAGQILAPANYNSIGQTVISGELPAVQRAIVVAKELGAKLAKLLPVSVPSHCELMKPAADKLAERLNSIDIIDPIVPVVANADASLYLTAEEVRAGLVKQLYNPVQWVETVQFLSGSGVDCFIECGPGKVLAGLNKRIVDNVPTLSGEQLLLELK